MEVSSRKERPAQEQIKDLEGKVKFYKETVAKANAMKEELGGELWKQIKARMDSKVRAIDDFLHKFDEDGVEDKKIFAALGERRQCMNILGIEEFANSTDQIEKILEEAQAEIRRLKRK